MSKKNRKEFYTLEHVFKGAANHRRLEILMLLTKRNNLSTDEIVTALGINYQTAVEHLRRLVLSGLALSYREGSIVRYAISSRGEIIMGLWKKL